MSHSTFYAAESDGNLVSVQTYPNGWGSAAFVWTSLCMRYAIAPTHLTLDQWPVLWAWAAKDPGAMEWWELATLRSTYDRVVVCQDDFKRLAEAFRLFCAHHRRPSMVCHYQEYAKRLDLLHWAGSWKHCAWQHTSSGDEDWVVHEGDDCRPYNVRTDTGHKFLDLSLAEGS